MGGCTSDFYKVIKKQHGQLFQKFIIGSESLNEFKRRIKIKLDQFDAKVESKRQNLHAQVNQREQMMMYHLNEVKLNLDGQMLGGIENYEQMKKVKIDNILGLGEYKNRFIGVHDQINREINDKKQKIHSQLQEIVRKAEQQYTIDPQKMTVYHEMPEEKRVYIRDRGVKEFNEQIKRRIDDLQDRNKEELDIELRIKKLDSVVSLEQVDHLTNMAKNKFKTQALHITGGFIDSTIVI